MEKTIHELADEIVREIEREDFIYAIKHYGYYKMQTTVKDIKKWWNIDEQY
jgi:hypothetical protein